jgi:hypothetical protein
MTHGFADVSAIIFSKDTETSHKSNKKMKHAQELCMV